ncbi:NUDIX hydrolase [Williamsia maris]|uniref:8-oxo-dGTP pyrophosphatase MutT, NUDIX family n=1 Tax=Williamsia maris TaxID=72806 RepID=A0ABT1HHR0_9NOCA|nr:NUDIX domain-containing protein [Williamsia maris]MCP2177273.1 8-oxo-dGTP pyrophosphatase MutT, NUDIX family [Williamsia maris]
MSTASLHTSATRLLTDWDTTDRSQDSMRHTVLAFLAARDDACLRSCAPGHLTASTLILDHTGTHTLLTLHPRVGAWIQVGGHCEESDDTLHDAAAREAREESGIGDLALSTNPIALHTHPITCSLGIPTRHLDVRFLGIAPEVDGGGLPDIVRSDESVDLRWWPVGDLPDDTHRPEMTDLVAAAIAAAGGVSPV